MLSHALWRAGSGQGSGTRTQSFLLSWSVGRMLCGHVCTYICVLVCIYMCVRSVTVQLLPKACTKVLVFIQCLKLQVFGEKEKKEKIF